MEINTKTKAGFITIIRVLQRFWTRGPASRAALALELELDKSTLTKVCGRLLEAGLIHQVREGAAGSQGGRRPSLLDINPEKGAIAGLEIGPERLSMVYTDLKGNILLEKTREIHNCDAGIDKLIETTQNSFSSEIHGLPVLGAGIALPGIVNTEEGTIIRSAPLHVDGEYLLAEKMEQALGVPAVCDNDANCCAWGSLFGIPALVDRVSFAALTGSIRDSGLSCGFAFVLGGGEVYNGNQFSTGEFRSIFCPDEGDRQVASAQTPKESLTELCRSTAFLATMLNLDAIVLAGTLTAEVENFRAQLHRELRRNRHYRPAPECPVYCAPKGEHASTFGAAALFLRRLCRIPVLGKTGSWFDGRLFQQVFGSSL